MQISLLDFGFFDARKRYPNDVISDLLSMVVKAEELGFSRYWLGEHYESSVAWRNTEILIGILCGLTEKIKIGAGGVLLKLHHPIHVTQNFKLLELLYPGRIDLGVAAGVPPLDVLRAYKIERESAIEMFKTKVNELLAFLRNDFEELDPYRSISIPPVIPSLPPVWMLGSSGSAELALQHKTNFCISLIHNGRDVEFQRQTFLDFKKRYEDLHGIVPECAIAVAGVCSKTNEDAAKIMRNYKYTSYSGIQSVLVSGNAEVCSDQLRVLEREFDCHEIFFLDVCEDQIEKLETYQRIAINIGR